MSVTLGIHIGESFWEAAVNAEGKTHTCRWYSSNNQSLDPIRSFLSEHNINPSDIKQVRLSTKVAQQIVSKRMGNSPAFLVTAGLENWLEMSLPTSTPYFTVKPERPKSPLNRDFVFGVSERTSPEGEVIREVNMEEIEFLVAKLQMNNITNVAIGFLHSGANQDNEKRVADYLSEKGFSVFPSYLAKLNFERDDLPASNERWRWWQSVLDAYAHSSFVEILDEIKTALHECLENEVDIQVATSDGRFTDTQDTRVLNTAFGYTSGLCANAFKSSPANEACYFGIEDFVVFPRSDEMTSIWRSEFGPVALSSRPFRRLKVQPTQLIAKSFWGVPGFLKKELGYEPGPMCLGKGFRPTFLDMLFLKGKLNNIEALSSRVKEKSAGRITDELFAYSKEAASFADVRPHSAADQFFEVAMLQLASEIQTKCLSNNIYCYGPLAKALASELKPYLGKNLIIEESDAPTLASSLLTSKGGVQ